RMSDVYFFDTNYLIFGNSCFEMALERDGRLRWIINKKTEENYVKNHYNRWILKILDSDKKEFNLGKPDYFWQDEELCIYYKNQLEVEIRIKVLPDNPESIWTLRVKNSSSEEIMDIIFPHISGIYLGDNWRDNYLVYPYIAGERIENPVETFAMAPSKILWDWLDYRYVYIVDGVSTTRDNELYVRELPYSGPVSMSWMDYYNRNAGFYMASYDEDKTLTYVRAETPGPDCPCMGFNFRKRLEISSGEEKSFTYGIGIHPGDWHWGADRYREWFYSVFPKRKESPDWLLNSSGLIAHYDFRYQNGSSFHSFDDIPALFDKNKEQGMDHLFISGWNEGGFDNGYPLYTPDKELGGEEIFKSKIDEVNNKGGHITTYINVRIVNTSYIDRIPEGILTNHMERYGAVDFYVVDPSSDRWHNLILETVKNLVDYGVSGVYLDELAMAGAFQDIPDWIRGYTAMLDKIVERYPDKVFIIEGCSDMYGRYVDLQLVSTFFYWYTSYPELFRYTFPDRILVDMIYPEIQTMRPAFVSGISKELLNRAFILGMYPWIYDLEVDNCFEDTDYLKEYLKLREIGMDFFNGGKFLDDLGIETVDDIRAKLYRKGDSYMVAVYNRDKIRGKLEFKWLTPPLEVEAVYSERVRYRSDSNIIEVPQEERSLIFISKPGGIK
ncbi:MAG TPA: DUF6259 domain-containing protein, partial [bacterium]|nr:DUF6259 domain-containing protein [bacterium]